MSETFEQTRGSIGRLKAALRDADEDTRYRFAFWLTGLGLMATAIVWAFGWAGIVFCGGVVIWTAGNGDNPRRT